MSDMWLLDWIIRLELLGEGKLCIFHCSIRDFDGLLKKIMAMVNSLVFVFTIYWSIWCKGSGMGNRWRQIRKLTTVSICIEWSHLCVAHELGSFSADQKNVAHISTFIFINTCLAVCFTHSKSFSKLTLDVCTDSIFVRVCLQLPRSKWIFSTVRLSKIRPINWGYLKWNYTQILISGH